MTRRVPPLVLLGRALGGLLLVALLGFGLAMFALRRADIALRQLLTDFAVNTVERESGGAYHLAVGRVRFNWALRHLSVDSAVVVTDSGANARRAQPLPGLRVGLYGCTVTGVSLRRLLLRQGLVARRFGCGVMTVDVAIAPGAAAEPAPAVRDQEAQPMVPFLVLQQGLKLPARVPRLRIRRIDFPHASLVLTRPRAAGGVSRIALEHLEWHIDSLSIDPDDPLAATRPLFSRSVRVAADNFTFQPDSASRVAVGRLRVSVTDSLLEVGSVAWGPTVSDGQFARARPWRRTRVKLAAGAVAARGFDFGRLMRRGGFAIRRLDVDSFVADIWSDKRLPPNPRPASHLTPQAWLAAGPGGYDIDTLEVAGRVTYRETREGHDRSGILTFARLHALGTNIRHVVGRRTTDDPMTLAATAYLMNAGRLDVTFTVPLDAPAFTMAFTGRLGAMPAQDLNGFVEHVLAARISGGDVSEIRFAASVRGGHARGEVIPIYRGLNIDITGRGADGILGGRGELAKLARGIASFVANNVKIRDGNPERPNRPPRAGPIDHVFVPKETLPAFLWNGVRDGLLGVVKK